MIRFRCKRCKQKIGVPVEYAARLVRCPECRQPVRVPVESQFDGVDLASARVLDDLRALAAGQALTREEQAQIRDGLRVEMFGLRRTFFNGRQVEYACPSCGELLRNPLKTMAGRSDRCPVCLVCHIVPGVEIARKLYGPGWSNGVDDISDVPAEEPPWWEKLMDDAQK